MQNLVIQLSGLFVAHLTQLTKIPGLFFFLSFSGKEHSVAGREPAALICFDNSFPKAVSLPIPLLVFQKSWIGSRTHIY